MNHDEHLEQCALMEWWALAHRTFFLPEELLFAIPNGGRRDAKTGAFLKREGVRRGVPDLFLAVPRTRYNGLFIEMKSKKGVLSPFQKALIKDIEEQCYKVVVCYSFKEAKDSIVSYLNNVE